jgi:uncharacterized protein YecT (DUF1311 family)
LGICVYIYNIERYKMIDYILFLTSPNLSVRAFTRNWGVLQFQYLLATVLVIWATSSFAQESLLSEPELAPLHTCLQKHSKDAGMVNEPAADQLGMACISLAVAPLEQRVYAGRHAPNSACLHDEYEWWDVQLNQAYQGLMKEAKQADAVEKNCAFRDVDSLRQMQRTWLGYRDANCLFSYMRFGGGTAGPTVEAECLLLLTGRQTLFLTSFTVRWAGRVLGQL